MTIHRAEDVEQSAQAVALLLAHIRNTPMTEEDTEKCEPRIRISYGDFEIDLLNLAQTYNGFEDGLSEMLKTIIDSGW